MSDHLEIAILAAGIGSRMRSNKAKVLQTLAAKPLLGYLLDAVEQLNPAAIHVVIGQDADNVKAAFSDLKNINWVHQAERLGTGHAMQQVYPHLQGKGRVLVLLGDCPLIQSETIRGLVGQEADLSILTVDMDDPFNYGRIIRDGAQILQIVEEKDANDVQKRIKEINTGVMAADVSDLGIWLSQLTNDNAQAEYLLTDIVEHANADGKKVSGWKVEDPFEVTGINTCVQLAGLERALQSKQTEELMLLGVQVMDPSRLDIRGAVTAGQGVRLDVNVILEGEVTLGDNVDIGPNCLIKDSTIESGVQIRANSVIEEATVGPGAIIGPFARLRPGAELAAEVHIGNFVEVKKSYIGRGSKANHLAYIGDATIGEGVNYGAGAITCNYDGANKHQTVIEDDAFIGTNVSLVAPVTVGTGATVGAGSTVSKDVGANELAVARGKQVAIKNWNRPGKDKK
jgi:bifunctional UDP-N-acetylglucosamine pyrophosphorylase/glucosamine-1-phosphate N-acetyltransferase